MLKRLSNIITGDKYLVAFIMLLAIFSLLPVYSASSSIEYAAQTGTIMGQVGKQIAFLVIGLLIMFTVQKINYRYIGAFAVLLLPIVGVLLIITLMQGSSNDGVNASRWLRIPGIPITIQTSTLASLILLTYIARYLTKIRDKQVHFIDTLLPLVLPVLVIIGLIFPANGSTAMMLFLMVIMLLWIGGYPLKFLLILGAIIVFLAGGFITYAMNTDNLTNSRVQTWKNRIDRYTNPTEDSYDSWQEYNAKAAIVEGDTFGKGPGKSAIKHTLPQASSDFIYAVIVEEFGLFGGLCVMLVFFSLLFRIIIIATKVQSYFAMLLCFAVGIPIIFQALLNMGVAVGLLPTTGQPLPMISYGGTSLWITCLAFGIILSVSREIKQEGEEETYNDEYIQEIA